MGKGLIIGALTLLFGSGWIRWMFFSDNAGSIIATVIVPCYNCRPDWLEQTLQSVSAQTIASNIEVILVDDGSEKGPLISSENLKNIANFRVHRHWKNMGLSAARNTGAVLASGQYIVFLDPDDFIEPEAIEKMILLKRSYEHWPESKVAFIYPAVVHFTNDPNAPQSIERSRFDSRRLVKENFIPSFALISRELYLEMGGMCEEHIVHFEDYDFWLRLAGFGLKGGLLDEPVFFYRRHEHGRSRKIVKSGIDWKSELRRNNPFAYGDAIYFEGSKADLRSIVPCKKSLPGFSLLALWLWRSNLLPTSWPTVEMARVPIRSDPVDIMMILPWLQVGGADYYDLEVSKALSSMGLKTMLILDVTGNDNPLISEFRAHVTGIFNLFTLLPMNHEQEDVDGLLDHFIETRRPKIVYVRNSTNGYKLSKRHANVKFVDIQHMWTPDDQLGWEYSSIPYADNLSLRLVISHQLKSIVQRLQNSSTLVSVVPPSVNMTLFTQKEPQKCWAESETVIFVGRLQEQKDPIKWIKVAKELSMRDPTMLFLMIGDGYLRDQVKLDLSTYLPGKHLLLPFQKQRELVEYLTYGLKRDSGSILRQGICPGRTLLLMTSRNEGLPYVILEAAALRVPSVAPRVGAIAEAELLLDGLLTSVASNDILAYVEAIDNAFQRSASIIEFPPTYRAEKFQKTIQELFNSLLQ